MLAILAPMALELQPVLAKLPKLTPLPAGSVRGYTGTLHGTPVVAATIGIGKVRAAISTQAILDRFAPEAVLLTGTAGAVAPDAQPLEVVLASRLAFYDLDPALIPLVARDYYPTDAALCHLAQSLSPDAKVGTIVTGDRFLSSAAEKAVLFSRFAARCADMESAAVAQTCRRSRVPLAVIRCLSDRGDGTAEQDFQHHAVQAAERAAALVCRIAASLAVEQS